MTQSTIDSELRLLQAKKRMEWNEERYGEPTILEYLRYYKSGVIGEIHIEAAIAQEAKAFGGCRNCYGKGYATVRKGTTAKGKTWDLRTHINYCSCDRGKQLQQVVAQEANKAVIAELERLTEIFIAKGGGVPTHLRSRLDALTADKEQA